MFKLIAVLFTVANGVPSERPSGFMAYNQEAFSSKEACMKFAETDAGKSAIGEIETAAKSQELAVKFACVKSKTEDNTI